MDPIFLLVVFALMMVPMLLISGRQRKAARQQQEKLKLLQVGDEVRTHSGFFGLLVDSYDDIVILETESGAQTKWLRAAIAQKVEPTDAAAEDREATASSLEEPADDIRDRDEDSFLADGPARDEDVPSSLEEPGQSDRIGHPHERIGEDPGDRPAR